jgi:hypothetical protein
MSGQWWIYVDEFPYLHAETRELAEEALLRIQESSIAPERYALGQRIEVQS